MFNEGQLKDFKAKVQHYVQLVRQSQLPLVITDKSEENVVLMDAGTFAMLTEIAIAANLAMQASGANTSMSALESLMGAAPAPKQKSTAKSPSSKSRSKKTSDIYQLKITLKNIKPPVWRRVLVPSDFTLDQLHRVIQATMDRWYDYHLHEFIIDRTRYGDAAGALEAGDFVEEETRVQLQQVLRGEKHKFEYTYDFGDDWEHEILLEKILPRESDQTYPCCIKGKRSGPPEDCGGPWGYADFLAAIGDPKHPEHQELLEWAGGEFDPEFFDLEEINQELAERV
jgi:prevent-host-death family protein